MIAISLAPPLPWSLGLFNLGLGDTDASTSRAPDLDDAWDSAARAVAAVEQAIGKMVRELASEPQDDETEQRSAELPCPSHMTKSISTLLMLSFALLVAPHVPSRLEAQEVLVPGAALADST